MKLIREHINFERDVDPLDSMKMGKQRPFKKGEIIITIPPSTFENFKLLYVFDEMMTHPIKGMQEWFVWDIYALLFGNIVGNPSYVNINFDAIKGNIVAKSSSDLRHLTFEEIQLVKKALNKPNSQKYIDRATELIGVVPFV
jgi:hypothetical protein